MKETDYKSYLIQNDDEDTVEFFINSEDKNKILLEVSEVVEDKYGEESYDCTSIYLSLSKIKELRDVCDMILKRN